MKARDDDNIVSVFLNGHVNMPFLVPYVWPRR